MVHSSQATAMADRRPGLAAGAPIGGHLLPRRITPDVLWTGGCMELELRGELVHSHFGNYVVRGTRKTLLVDTGHPIHAEAIESALDGFLGERPIDYIFPTHGEFPHFGLLPKWMRKYPDALVVGDARDYPLYYPEESHRFRVMSIGDAIDLGGREFAFVPAVWCDLKDTLWGFDTGDRILFVADGFSLTHHHTPGHCGLTAGELPAPEIKMMQLLNELALQWTRYTDATQTFAPLDALLDTLRPRFIAPAHGSVVDRPDDMLPLVKAGMQVMPQLNLEGGA